MKKGNIIILLLLIAVAAAGCERVADNNGSLHEKVTSYNVLQHEGCDYILPNGLETMVHSATCPNHGEVKFEDAAAKYFNLPSPEVLFHVEEGVTVEIGAAHVYRVDWVRVPTLMVGYRGFRCFMPKDL